MIIVQADASRILTDGVPVALALTLRDVSGALLSIASGTLTVYLDGIAVLTDEAITPGAPATYQVTPSGDGRWVEVWTVTLDDDREIVCQVAGDLTPGQLACPFAADQFQKAMPALAARLPVGESLGWAVRSAWETVLRRLRSRTGRLPGRVVSAADLYEVTWHKAAAEAYWQEHSRTNSEGFKDSAIRHDDLYEREWGFLNLDYRRAADGPGQGAPAAGGAVLVFGKGDR